MNILTYIICSGFLIFIWMWAYNHLQTKKNQVQIEELQKTFEEMNYNCVTNYNELDNKFMASIEKLESEIADLKRRLEESSKRSQTDKFESLKTAMRSPSNSVVINERSRSI